MADAGQQNGELVLQQHVPIEIELMNKDLVDSIKGDLDSFSSSSLKGSQCSIYRVAEKFRRINEYAYTPEMISIGPFHRGKGNLLAMEDVKLHYVHAMLPQTDSTILGRRRSVLEECVQSIREIEEEARKSYSEPINMSSNDFVKMMLFDGLFIIEVLRKSARELTPSEKIDDPIFGHKWKLPSLLRDLVLLENQIPMLVLNRLFNLPALKEVLQCKRSFTELALHLFNPLMHRSKEVRKTRLNCVGKHLLDLLGKSFHYDQQREGRQELEKNESKKESLAFIPTVTELKRAGVKFKKGFGTNSFLDIKFSNGVMEIPPIVIKDQTDSLLRNLIASEQYCCGKQVTYMTSYAFFMDRLINSADDVGLLRNKGIIINYLGDDADVSDLFNKLCCELNVTNFYYDELCNQVNTYYETRWHRWRATLIRNYFDSPWTIISVIVGVLLLVLTLTSTIFATLSYIVHKS